MHHDVIKPYRGNTEEHLRMLSMFDASALARAAVAEPESERLASSTRRWLNYARREFKLPGWVDAVAERVSLYLSLLPFAILFSAMLAFFMVGEGRWTVLVWMFPVVYFFGCATRGTG